MIPYSGLNFRYSLLHTTRKSCSSIYLDNYWTLPLICWILKGFLNSFLFCSLINLFYSGHYVDYVSVCSKHSNNSTWSINQYLFCIKQLKNNKTFFMQGSTSLLLWFGSSKKQQRYGSFVMWSCSLVNTFILKFNICHTLQEYYMIKVCLRSSRVSFIEQPLDQRYYLDQNVTFLERFIVERWE